MGTKGKTTSLRVPNQRQCFVREVVKQIEVSRLPDPIMRRLRADREEKRVTHGTDSETLSRTA